MFAWYKRITLFITVCSLYEGDLSIFKYILTILLEWRLYESIYILHSVKAHTCTVSLRVNQTTQPKYFSRRVKSILKVDKCRWHRICESCNPNGSYWRFNILDAFTVHAYIVCYKYKNPSMYAQKKQRRKKYPAFTRVNRAYLIMYVWFLNMAIWWICWEFSYLCGYVHCISRAHNVHISLKQLFVFKRIVLGIIKFLQEIHQHL